jgi:selenoprotein W-related protein
MTAVAIEYCVSCGFLDRALSVEEALLRQFGTDLDRVSLVTGDNGIFVVRVADETVFDVATDGFDVDEIVRRVRSHAIDR